MSDEGYGREAIGVGIAAAIGLLVAFIRGLFTRNVGAADRASEEMRSDVKNILLELRSMHDEQTRQRADIAGLSKDLATVAALAKAAHERVDALVTLPPKGGRR